MIEREIGEVFTYHVPDAPMKIKLQCVEIKSNKCMCMYCEFEYACLYGSKYIDSEQIGPCSAKRRKDNKNVKFIRLGKA